MNIVVREYLGNKIEFKMINGKVYANATSFNEPQKLGNWKRSEKTKELIEELSNMQNLHISKLIFSERGQGENSGTWIHETLVLDFAQYISVKLRVWVQQQIATLIRERKQVKSILNALESVEFNGSIDNLVYSKNGIPITTSRIIANKFNKEHREILRAIDNKLEHKNETIVQFCTVNIKSVEYLSENGQQYREYELTEQGFNFIALSLTGENADIHKIKFIESYHKIRETLLNMFKARLIEEILPQDNRLRQYVYIIENCDNGAIKIGVGNDPEKRLKQLQTGSVSELSIVYRSNLCSNAFEIEKFMHSNFEEFHIRGEWFKVCKTKVVNELEKQKFVLKSEFIKELGLTGTIFDDIEKIRQGGGLYE